MKTIAVVGLGYWGPYLLRNAMGIENLKVKTICDISREKVEKCSRRYSSLETTRNFNELLEDNEIEGLIISTPAGLHYEQARHALLAGKHVLVEKPLAMTVAEARELKDLADKKGCILMVGHTFLYNAAVRMMKTLYESGELGELYFIMSQRMSLGKVREDVNVLWNLAPHDYSILLYLLGTLPEWVAAYGARYLQNKFEDVVFATAGFSNRVLANLQLNWLNPVKVRQMVVVGSKKMLIYDDVNVEARITLFNRAIEIEAIESTSPAATFSEFQAKIRRGEATIPHFVFTEPLYVEVSHFAECMETGETPLTDGAHGIKVTHLIEATETSLREGKKIKV